MISRMMLQHPNLIVLDQPTVTSHPEIFQLQKPIVSRAATRTRPTRRRPGDLIMSSIGAVIGAGIFSSIGTAAAARRS